MKDQKSFIFTTHFILIHLEKKKHILNLNKKILFLQLRQQSSIRDVAQGPQQ